MYMVAQICMGTVRSAHNMIATARLEADEDWAEDLLQPAVHAGLDAADEGRADEVAALVAGHAHASAVQQQFGALQMKFTDLSQSCTRAA